MILALDTASPRVSVAVGTAEELHAERTLGLRRSSEKLLAAIEEALEEAGTALGELAGCAVVRGPGSFTGLRIGLGTALGFHQALGMPVAALSALSALAASAGGGAPEEIVAAVDAMRGDWYLRRFAPGEGSSPPRPRGEAELVAGSELAALGPCRFVAFGAEKARDALAPGAVALEAEPLARWVLRLAAHPSTEWRADDLTKPIYFRAPAVTAPKKAAGGTR